MGYKINVDKIRVSDDWSPYCGNNYNYEFCIYVPIQDNEELNAIADEIRKEKGYETFFSDGDNNDYNAWYDFCVPLTILDDGMLTAGPIMFRPVYPNDEKIQEKYFICLGYYQQYRELMLKIISQL